MLYHNKADENGVFEIVYSRYSPGEGFVLAGVCTLTGLAPHEPLNANVSIGDRMMAGKSENEMPPWDAISVAADVHKAARSEYQVAIDTFKEKLDRIDWKYDAYAKIDYDDAEVHVMRMRGMYTKPRTYNRRISLGEIVLEFTGADEQ